MYIDLGDFLEHKNAWSKGSSGGKLAVVVCHASGRDRWWPCSICGLGTFSYRAAALCTTTVLQTTVHCRLVVRKLWGIGGYSLSYGLHNCIDCIGSSFLGHYLFLIL